VKVESENARSKVEKEAVKAENRNWKIVNSPMVLRLSQAQIEAIRQHGARDYPNECCGILLGHADAEQKIVSELVALKNLRQEPERAQELMPLESPASESERNRFLLDPREQLQVEREARARGLEVLGYYHSHPDHPARPSTYDREHAWPWYSYVIVSVEAGEPKELTSWVLAEDRSRFGQERIDNLE
jgi:proteasome lid subunit RPN8/RPN11